MGKNFSTFEMRFRDDYFQKYNLLTGYDGVPILIKSDPVFKDGMWCYDCVIMDPNPNMSIPQSAIDNANFQKDYSIIEKTLEKR